MTICLATRDDKGIYLAADSVNLPAFCASPSVCTTSALTCKIVELQRKPEMLLLVAGGLNHWLDVVLKFQKQNSLEDAAERVWLLLDECTSRGNQAFGRLFGYQSGMAHLCRIDRLSESDKPTRGKVEPFPTDHIEPLGRLALDLRAVEKARSAIKAGCAPLAALVQSIGECMDEKPDAEVRYPIHSCVLRPPPIGPAP